MCPLPQVYLGTWRATPVAAKVLLSEASALTCSMAELNQADMTRQLLAEAQVMSAMRHPNLVTFMGVCLLPPCILTEHCSQGSLYGVLRQAAQDPTFAAQLTWRRRLAMVRTRCPEFALTVPSLLQAGGMHACWCLPTACRAACALLAISRPQLPSLATTCRPATRREACCICTSPRRRLCMRMSSPRMCW